MSEKMLEAALEYAARGWPIFPCRSDKTPYTPHGVLDATTDEKRIRKWWAKWPGANIGLNAGEAGLAVLDYDPGSSPAKVRKTLQLRETGLIAKTPRGGTHEYYELGDDEIISSSSNRVAEHVDVRSFHGYVLLPPSKTKDGEYEWVSEKRPAYRSNEFAIAAETPVKDKNRDNWIIEADLEENRELAENWLRQKIKIGESYCKYAIEGQGGDHTTFATAAMMKSCGMSEEAALELMWEHWNPQCEPPWDYDELEVKVRNGYSYNTSPPGNVTQAYKIAQKKGMFRPIEERELGTGTEIDAGKYRIVNRGGIDAIQPPDWIIPDMIPEDSYVMLVGPPGSYKSALALDIGLTIATAGPIFQAEWAGLIRDVKQAGPVLYIAGEGRGGFKNRIEAWEHDHLEHQNKKYPFYLVDPVPHVTDEDIDVLIEGAKKRHETYRLVILDTVARSMQGVNENAQENATAFTKLVDTLRRELGATVLALHHTGWENQERGRGSSAFLGDVDTLLVLEKPEKGSAILKMVKQKDWPEWEEPRYLAIKTVWLDAERESFVLHEGKKPVKTAGEKIEHLKQGEVEHMIMETLKAHHGQEFSDRQLSIAVAHQSGRAEHAIRKWLPVLRADETSAVHDLYDASPRKMKWAWRGMANGAGKGG